MNNIGTNKNLKVGDRVKIDWNVCKWAKQATNPQDTEGEVMSLYSETYLSDGLIVQWDNGETNQYKKADSDLILVSSQKPEGSWFEKGEFPPAGTVCEVLHCGEWIKTFIVGMDDTGYCVYVAPRGAYDFYCPTAVPTRFRPTREPSKEEMIVAQLKSVAPDVSEENLKLVYEACKKLIEEE